MIIDENIVTAPSLLIVDDNAFFVDRMIHLLAEAGNLGHINVAGEYYEAVRIIDEKNPDIILLDIHIPGKNGVTLLKKIKEKGCKSRVIMISNHSDDIYRKQCKHLGADYFLDKSHDFSLVPGIIFNLQ